MWGSIIRIASKAVGGRRLHVGLSGLGPNPLNPYETLNPYEAKGLGFIGVPGFRVEGFRVWGFGFPILKAVTARNPTS